MQYFITHYKEILTILTLIGIEISPIKINPFTWLGRICGKTLGIDEIKKNQDKIEENFNNKVDELKKKIEMVNKKVDINEIDRIKYEISQFSGSLRNGLKREEFDYQHIEELYSKYKSLGGNSFVANEMNFIRSNRNKIDK